MIGVSSDSAVLVTAMCVFLLYVWGGVAPVYYARIRVGTKKTALSELPDSLYLVENVLDHLGIALLVSVSRARLV